VAKGGANGGGGWLAAGLVLLVVLVSTGVWNPFPAVFEWVNRSRPLSTPELEWQQRLGGVPKSVTVTSRALVVEHRTTVEARSLVSGDRLWETKADWGAVAGVGTGAVVAVGKLLTKGYEVIDPHSGAVLRRDTEAVAVWTYRDALLDVRCAGPRECTLTAWDPKGNSPQWTVRVPGIGFVLFADNPDLLGSRPVSARHVKDDAAGPESMPQLLGFPVNGRVYLVDTAAGRALGDFEADRKQRIVVVGGRVLRVEARSSDGTCYFTVTASDGLAGREVWTHRTLNLRTSEGAGCAQRRAPAGRGSVLVGTQAEGREVVIDAYDGRALWTADDGERVLGVDDVYALVRSADGRTIRGVQLGQNRAVWIRDVNPRATAALTGSAAVIVDRDPDRILALEPATGRELINLRTSADVLAVGPEGLVVGERREIGYARFAGAAQPAPDTDEEVPGQDGVPGQPDDGVPLPTWGK
jgi:outer membrane protein assembly factor BamB